MSHTKVGFVFAACLLGCSVSSVVYQPDPTTSGTAPTAVFDGVAVQADVAPPPISGGTVRIGKSGSEAYAVVSDPDENAIDVVALGDAPHVVGQVALLPGDEPNRIAFDDHGLAHVVLRGGGSILTIDPTTASTVSRRSVCPAPRGIAYDASADDLYVACATGELVTLPSTGAVSKVTRLDRDLRDVLVAGDHLVVTRFRSAERLVVNSNGAIVGRNKPGPSKTANYSSMAPVVAWRTLLAKDGTAVMLHQLAATEALVVVPQQTYYASTGSPISASAVSVEAFGNVSGELQIEEAIDMALDENGMFEALSVTGDVQLGFTSAYSSSSYFSLVNGSYYGNPDNTYQFVGIDDGGPIGVPYKVVQRRAPSAELEIFGTSFDTKLATLALPQKASHVDTGFDIFHIPTFVGTACMSCHPEGGEDGHTWKFTVGGVTEARRTQSLRGGVVTSTAPYHWNGDLATLGDLCDEVFTHRMGGGKVEPTQEAILAHWMNAIPRIPVRPDLDAKRVEAGKAIFDGAGGCGACHVSGAGTITTNQDIGKTDILGESKPLQVPSLLDVADRAPYMHDGCAATLMDRFTNPDCGGATHGSLAQLSQEDLVDLTAYLESL